jgi:TetR/AcrR family transcriptional regulator, transcriptional repressor for nem operon
MPYPPDHKTNTRAQIVESARRLFNRHGFENVSLKQIMAGAGLTHGGFYSYFKGKSDLYSEVLGCFFTDPKWKNCWEGVEVDLKSSDAGRQIIQAYLSRQHFDDVENSCPMVALPSDVSRAGKTAKRAFNKVFQGMVAALGRSMPKGRNSASTAQAVAALCVGGMVVARAIEDGKVADKLRDDCMAVALHIGGWAAARRARPKRAAV